MAEQQDSVPVTPDEAPDSGLTSSDSAEESPDNRTPSDAQPFSGRPHPQLTASFSMREASRESPPSPRRLPSLRTASDPQTSTAHMSSSSSVSGTLNSARRIQPSAGNLPPDIMQKARALQQQRMAMSPHHPGMAGLAGAANSPLSHGVRGAPPGGSGVGGALAGGVASNLQMPPNMGGVARPSAPGFPKSASAVPGVANRPGGPSLSERRAMKLGSLGEGAGGVSPRGGPPKLSDMGGGRAGGSGGSSGVGGPSRPSHLRGTRHDSRMNDFRHYIDTEKGWITFQGAATIKRTGVDFAGGHTFKISLDEIEVLKELGKGNYGTVYKVRHARPSVPRFGPGLSGFKTTHIAAAPLPSASYPATSQASASDDAVAARADATADGKASASGGSMTSTSTSTSSSSTSVVTNGTTGKVMAMKEIRLELDEAKFGTILKELVILHECVSPFIIDFYGAFFQEGAVYMCIEYMDGGSIDKLYANGIPEAVLRRITYSTVMGLKTLKDKHNIIHRDVKPTNILANSKGQIKICDFGVSGNLVASIAKTNIGCQSYMAPERISGGGAMQGANAEGTYSVQSDIWSLGLTIIECATGQYPYPPDVSSTIFSQLSAIVNGEPPEMPSSYSAEARDFVRACLDKNPLKRYTYAKLLNHPWLRSLAQAEEIDELDEHDDHDESGDLDPEAEQSVEAVGKSIGDLNLDANATPIAGDAEVAAWVTFVLEQRERGALGTPSAATRPALHAAPLGQ